MYLPDMELHEASSLAEASELMRRYAPDARFLAGGTDLLVDLKSGMVSTGHVVSLNRIGELRGVTSTDSELRIGALTTANQLAASPIVRERFPSILDATRDMAAPQIRNMATVGGNIASAVPSADLPPILIVLNASVVLWSPEGERRIPLDSFFTGPRRTARQDDEVLTAIVIPNPPPGLGAAYARFALREANACAVAGVAASVRLDGENVIRRARIAIGCVAPIPKLVESAASLLVGRAAEPDAFEDAAATAAEAAEPISDIRGSAEFRQELVCVLTRRALATATDRAREMRQ